MESSTFSHINFIVKADEAANFVRGSDDFCSFLFDIESPLEVESAFSLIFSEKGPASLFSVTIPIGANSSMEEHWFHKLCLVLSHCRYKRVNNNVLIGILSSEASTDSGDTFCKQLGLQLSGQNFNFLLVELSQLHAQPNDFPFAYFQEPLSEEYFYRWYKDRLTNNTSLLNVFYKVDKEVVDKILLQKQNAEERLMKEDPVLFKLVQHDALFAMKEQQFKMTIENLANDLSSKSAYLDFLLQKNSDTVANSGVDLIPSMRIKKFYHDEYEILPLWYKRFGHIIKVIMGKRSFRSLFNDNVKKYKD